MDPITIAKNVNTIFSMPDVALRVNEIINLTSTTNAELEQIILHDTALTTKVLKFTNSAYFGLPGKIDTISRAVALIGYKELHNLVIATSVTSTFNNISSDLIDMEMFWYHSVICGVLAKLIATKLKRKEKERFFIAGLLHGIGKLILFSQFPEESTKALRFKEYGLEMVDDAEREIFGFTFAELGAEFLKQWQLPPSIWKLVEAQLDPLNETEYRDDACILHVAVEMANCIQPLANMRVRYDETQPINQLEIWDYLGISPADIQPMTEEANLQVLEILNILKPDSTIIF